MTEYTLMLASVIESETRLHEELKRILIDNSVPASELREFMLAVSEAFTNALVHGNRLDPSKLVKITVRINRDWLAADIVDEGKGGVDRISARGVAGPLAEGGRGVNLIQHYATRVEFSESDRGGLKVTIEYQRGQKKREQNPV